MKKASIIRLALAIFVGFSAPVFASEETVSGEDAILTISGDAVATPDNPVMSFDLEHFSSLPSETFSTSTIWTKGTQTFTGVPLYVLAEMLVVDSGTFKAFAVNDYAVEIPVSDAVEGGPIVAYLHNGKEMSLRDKGPLWIVYPFDAGSRYKSETYYARSIWQLNRIEVIPSP